jgi:hypothetical protein
MEFLKTNFVNTTTQIDVTNSGNTLTANYLLSWDTTFQYQSFDYNNDLTSASIVYNFDATQSVSRLALMDINLKDFSIYYDDTTTNLFDFTTTSGVSHTNSSSFTSNSNTSMLFRCATIQTDKITLKMNKTIIADQEKALGYFLMSDLHFDFEERLPSAKNYNPVVKRKAVIHRMSDGGTKLHQINRKKNFTIKHNYLDNSFTTALLDLHELNDSFVFSPFGTATGWDKFIFEGIWTNDYEFYKYADDAVSVGFKGSIRFSEI